MKIERRNVRGVELRAAADAPHRIVGHAAVFNSLSEEIFGFREVIMPRAFDRALAEAHDVRALVEHMPLMLLGRTKSGTLKLSVDDVGLLAEITPPDTEAARSAVVSIERGDIDGMSFAFIPKTTEWRLEDGVDIREVHDLDLVDVSVVAYPAYPETNVELNGLSVEQLEACVLGALVEFRSRLDERQPAPEPPGVPLALRQRQQQLLETR